MRPCYFSGKSHRYYCIGAFISRAIYSGSGILCGAKHYKIAVIYWSRYKDYILSSETGVNLEATHTQLCCLYLQAHLVKIKALSSLTIEQTRLKEGPSEDSSR